MKVIRTIAEMRRTVAAIPSQLTIGLVPTMGAFHEGHVALFQEARRRSDLVVVSLFVNPAQFNDPTDLAAYPRDERRDIELAAHLGVDYLFTPTFDEMYPAGYATWIEMDGPARGLEGDRRPGHFRGVATVCLKLFTITRPRLAFFGQKDAQQVAVIRRLVSDLNLDIDVQVVGTLRDRDGLAHSSRNVRLTRDQRKLALAIPRALEAGLAAARDGRDSVTAARQVLTDLEIDYVEIADFDGQHTLVIAARVGDVRLIDNVELTDAPSQAAHLFERESQQLTRAEA